MKRIIFRVAIAAIAAGAVASVAVASRVSPIGAHGSTGNPNLLTGATAVAFNPSANPAFKVNGGTECDKPNTTGHLWVDATLTATSVADLNTTEVRVEIGNGSKGETLSLTPGNSWTAVLSSATALPCGSVSGDALSYTATSYDGVQKQDVVSGTYPITLID